MRSDGRRRTSPHVIWLALGILALALPLLAEGPYRCEPIPVGPLGEICDNGIDDDGDGLIDCEDFGDCATDCGPHPDCPMAVIGVEEGEEVVPQTMLHLVGDGSSASEGTVARWEWTVEQPVGSASVFMPSSQFPNPQFEANVAGTYTFHLTVWDAQNRRSCVAATYEVLVIPDEALHIELIWHTPGDDDESDTGPFAGSDVDLHFLHPDAPSDPSAPDLDFDGLPDPYFDQPYDCYWFNPHPDWADFGSTNDDDPGLDRDDTDGAGPENINLNVPEGGRRYEVAVHYWNDHGYGAALATVRIYIYQTLVFEVADVRLINHDLWCAAYIDWPSGAVTPCENEAGAPRITPNYQHPMFFNK